MPQAPPEVLVPIRDDCAVLRLGGRDWAVASDMLVFGHHFKGWAAPEDVGYMAVAINISDVAAMGDPAVRPGLGRRTRPGDGAPLLQRGPRSLRGVRRLPARRRYHQRWGSLTVDVAILGELSAPPVLRSGARPGDLLAVTGELGASAAGLLALEGGAYAPECLVRRHLRPEPRVEVGSVAAGLGVGAMMDLSDGLATDARRVCERSGVGCTIDLDLLPMAEDTRRVAKSLGRSPAALAATGGEDYELLICFSEPVLDALAESVRVPLTAIGEVTEGADVVFKQGSGQVDGLSGWDHFSRPEED